MSFQDLLREMEAGMLPEPPTSPLQEVAHGVFQINTKVEALRWMAGALGTPKDTPALRGRLRGTRAGVTRLARSTSQALRLAADAARAGASSSSGAESMASSCSKLAMDFESAMNEYQKVERRIAAAERQETAAAAASTAARRSPFLPPPSSFPPPPSFNPSSASSDRNNGDLRFPNQKQTQLAVIAPHQDLVLLENEIDFNEALIAEREQGIREVQQEIACIHEIFRDLAVLAHDQGECIEIVTSNIDRTAAATSQAEQQLSRAAGIREAKEEKLPSEAGTDEENCSTKCLLLTVLVLFLFILGLVLVS